MRSARIEGTTEMGDTVSMEQTGTIGWSDGPTGSLTLTYTGGTMAEALKQGGGDGSVRARYLQDEYYADMGEAFAATIGGKRWVRYAYQDLAELGGPAGDVLEERLSAAGVTTHTVDIWVGEDGLPLKKAERGETAAGAFSSTVFYSDYGTEVSVRKPPAGDTVDFKEILRQRAAGPS
ncbi:hypothetical protein [Streptomyces sp. CS090A]|uniref:hypothetical protein n=1 Tax=Streptomyces sp. CS090A TaxID=2162710 RepID=UPI001952466A|nr:hypothetical protein [Streptomyces sp. CS090A]